MILAKADINYGTILGQKLWHPTLKEAIESEGYDADGIKEYLYGINGRVGSAGVLTIDVNGDPQMEYVLKRVEGGKVIAVG